MYRSENHFGPSKLHVLIGVLATHTQSVNRGPHYTYSDQNIVRRGSKLKPKVYFSTEVKIILV